MYIYKQAQASERRNVTLEFKSSTDGSRIKTSAAVKPHMLPSDQPRMRRKAGTGILRLKRSIFPQNSFLNPTNLIWQKENCFELTAFAIFEHCS